MTGALNNSSLVTLLVDDDIVARRIVRASLEVDGYQVLEAANGEEALAAWAMTNEPIQLLLCGIMLADMAGTELYQRLTLIHPQLKVLYISGHKMEPVIKVTIVDPQGSAQLKSITPSELIQLVSQLVHRPRAGEP